MDLQLRKQMVAHLKEHGALTRRDALEIGLTDRQLAGARHRGELAHPRHSLYIPSTAPENRWQQINQDVWAMRPVAFAAQRAALWLHLGNCLDAPFRREIVVPVLNGPKREEPPEVHRTRRLDEVDVRLVNGILATSLPRTLIDLAAVLDLVALTSLLDVAIVSGRTFQGEVFRRAEALSVGRRGVKMLIDLTQPGAAALFFSRLERLGAPLLIEAGLTDVQFNVVPEGARSAGRCDAVSERHKVVVEWDGLRFHASPGARQRDNDKGNALTGRYRYLRFTWRDLMTRPAYIRATTSRLCR